AARGARLWSRSFGLRGERGSGRPRLCVAKIGPCRVAAGGRAVEGPAGAAAGGSARGGRRRSPGAGRRPRAPAGGRLPTAARPAFVREAVAGDPSPQDVADGFMLTGFFLARRVLEPRGLSLADARASFIAALEHDARAAIG